MSTTMIEQAYLLTQETAVMVAALILTVAARHVWI